MAAAADGRATFSDQLHQRIVATGLMIVGVFDLLVGDQSLIASIEKGRIELVDQVKVGIDLAKQQHPESVANRHCLYQCLMIAFASSHGTVRPACSESVGMVGAGASLPFAEFESVHANR